MNQSSSKSPVFARSLTPSRRHWYVGVACVLVATALAYANSFAGQFVFDDHVHLFRSESLHQFPPTHWPRGFGLRPIWALSMAFDWWLWRDNPIPWHATNLVIHLTTTWLVMLVMRQMLNAPCVQHRTDPNVRYRLAIATGLLWGIHPLNTQAVTYVVQRAESLAVMWMLLGTWGCLHLCARRDEHGRWQGSGWFLFACVMLWLGLGTKEVAFGMLAGLPLLERSGWYPSWKRWFLDRRAFYFTLLAPGILVLPMILQVMSGSEAGRGGFSFSGVAWYEYLRTQPQVIMHYCRLVLLPWPQCFDYAWNIETRPLVILLTGAVVGGAAMIALYFALRGHLIAACAAWFFLSLAPSSSVVPLADLAVEHRMYFPGAILIALLVLLVNTGLSRASSVARLSCRLAIPLVYCIVWVLTVQRNALYADPVQLMRQTAQQSPQNSRVRCALADLLMDGEGLMEARSVILEACETAPDDYTVFAVASQVLRRTGEFPAAVQYATRALELNPDSIEVWWDYIQALEAAGDEGGAEMAYQAATELFPSATDYFPARQFRTSQESPVVRPVPEYGTVGKPRTN